MGGGEEGDASSERPRAAGVGLAVVSSALVGLAVVTGPFLRRFSGAPYVASTEASRRAIRAALRRHAEGAGRGRRLQVVDLGSGSGEVVVEAARDGHAAVGYELNVWLVAASRWRAARAGVGERARFVWGDMWEAEVGAADAVVVFGVPGIMQRVGRKLEGECRAGCLVCCNSFRIEGWRARSATANVWTYAVDAHRRGGGAGGATGGEDVRRGGQRPP